MSSVANEHRPGTVAGEMLGFKDTACDGRLEEFSVPIMMITSDHFARLIPFQDARQTFAHLEKRLMIAFRCQLSMANRFDPLLAINFDPPQPQNHRLIFASDGSFHHPA